jgi:DnaJ-class molecular chaperone
VLRSGPRRLADGDDSVFIFGIAFSVQGVTKPGEIRRIVGEGMPAFESNKKGDLFVTFTVAFPSSLTDTQKKVIRDNFSH